MSPAQALAALFVAFVIGIAVGEILSERRRLRAERDGRIEWDRVGPRVVDGGRTAKRGAARLESRGVA